MFFFGKSNSLCFSLSNMGNCVSSTALLVIIQPRPIRDVIEDDVISLEYLRHIDRHVLSTNAQTLEKMREWDNLLQETPLGSNIGYDVRTNRIVYKSDAFFVSRTPLSILISLHGLTKDCKVFLSKEQMSLFESIDLIF